MLPANYRCFPCRLESTSNGELLKDKLEKQELRGGLLLEFKKDTERVLLAVVQKPDGKKNWMVSDQVHVELMKNMWNFRKFMILFPPIMKYTTSTSQYMQHRKVAHEQRKRRQRLQLVFIAHVIKNKVVHMGVHGWR